MTVTAPEPTAAAPAVGSRVLAVTGWGLLSGVATDPAQLGAVLTGGGPGPVDASSLVEDPLPSPEAYALVDFRVRDHLGRKGTSFFDRATALAMVAAKQAFADSDLVVDDGNRDRVGIVFGTTAGSARSTSEYSRETFINERPYLVNPLIFPNAVMNCAAGQAGIWYGLRGPNATVAAGSMSALNGLRYTRNLLACKYADALLVGATEEFSAQSAWATRFAQQRSGGTTTVGEGSAMFVVEDAEAVRAAGRKPDAEILAVEVSLRDPAEPGAARAGLEECLRRALSRAGVGPEDVWAVATQENGMAALDAVEDGAVRAVLGKAPRRLRVKDHLGECHSATSVFQLAALFALHRSDPALDGRISVVTARSSDGAVGAAVVRGWSRAGGDLG